MIATRVKEKSEPVETLRVNTDTMRRVMSAGFDWFAQMGTVYHEELDDGSYRRHIYIDRGASVLGVAHLDSVRDYAGFWMNQEYIACSTIDNRMGAWLVLYGLPSLGVECDVLLTEDEETCMSTAVNFKPSKQYNWGFSFDRQGTDVACYEYLGREVREALAPYGLVATHGSYSDIADLDIGAKCFNFGCGMYQYHSPSSHVKVSELALQVRRFTEFYADYHAIHLPHTKERYDSWKEGRWWDGDYVKVSKTGTWDQEWDDYRRTGAVLPSWAGSSKWAAIDKYLAKRAVESPVVWFDGEANGWEWRSLHSFGHIDDAFIDDEFVEMYGDGVLDECPDCGNLYARGDVEAYITFGTRLCKACFREAALADPSWME